MRLILATAAMLMATGLAGVPRAQAQNRFWLVNDAGLTIERAFVSPSRLSDWGNDILGDTLLPPGEQVRVTPTAKDCELDIKVMYSGGQEEEKLQVNTCQLNRVVFSNPRNRVEAPGGRIWMSAGPGGARPQDLLPQGRRWAGLSAWRGPAPRPLLFRG
jgi:hypothetical protein